MNKSLCPILVTHALFYTAMPGRLGVARNLLPRSQARRFFERNWPLPNLAGPP